MIHRLNIEVRGCELLVEIPDTVSSHIQFAEAQEIEATVLALIKQQDTRWEKGKVLLEALRELKKQECKCMVTEGETQ